MSYCWTIKGAKEFYAAAEKLSPKIESVVTRTPDNPKEWEIGVCVRPKIAGNYYRGVWLSYSNGVGEFTIYGKLSKDEWEEMEKTMDEIGAVWTDKVRSMT